MVLSWRTCTCILLPPLEDEEGSVAAVEWPRLLRPEVEWLRAWSGKRVRTASSIRSWLWRSCECVSGRLAQLQTFPYDSKLKVLWGRLGYLGSSEKHSRSRHWPIYLVALEGDVERKCYTACMPESAGRGTILSVRIPTIMSMSPVMNTFSSCARKSAAIREMQWRILT